MSKSDTYWAAQPDAADVAREVEAKRKAYLEKLQATGTTQRAMAALRANYGWGPNGAADTSRLGQSGETGEFVAMALPEFAGLVEQVFAQLTETKAAYMVVPKTSDFEAQGQATLAEALLDSYDRDNGVEEAEDEATLVGLLCGEGWVASSWDKQGGSALGIEGSRIAYEGDVRTDVCLPWDVVVDVDVRHKKDLRWVAWCRPVSRWDLAALHAPTTDLEMGALLERSELQASIIAFQEPEDDFESIRAFLRGSSGLSQTASDQVLLWELRHLPTPALPQGRLIQFLSPEVILHDTAAPSSAAPNGAGYPYDTLCLRHFEPAKVVGTAKGHSMSWDLLGMAEAIDMVASAMATTAAASAVSNIWSPPGNNLSARSLVNGLNLVESTVKPEPLAPIQVDPQAVAFLESCRSWAVKRLGLSEVTRGEASKGMPAQLAALLDAKVTQFWRRANNSLGHMRAGIRTDILGILKRYAASERTATLAGKNNTWALEVWTKDKLNLASRVALEPVDAASKSIGGKLSMADALLERGLLKTPEQYMAVRTTGRLERLTEWQDMNLLRLQREKEMLRQGIGLPPVDAMATEQAMALDPEALPVFAPVAGKFIRPVISDTPWIDIPEYAAVMASPDARDNPKVVGACTDLIQYKMAAWRVMPPELIAALGGFPPPMDAMGVAPMPADGTEIPAEGGENADGIRRITPPKPPPNPLTGEQEPAASDVSQPA